MSNDNAAPETNAQTETPQPVDVNGNVILPPSAPEAKSPAPDYLPQTSEPVNTRIEGEGGYGSIAMTHEHRKALIEKLDAFLEKAECAAERDAKHIIAFLEKHI